MKTKWINSRYFGPKSGILCRLGGSEIWLLATVITGGEIEIQVVLKTGYV